MVFYELISIMRALDEWQQGLMLVSQSHITDVCRDPLPVHHPHAILKSWPDAPAG